MISAKEIKESLLRLLFPDVCTGCGSDLVDDSHVLCLQCINAMPETNFEMYGGNPVEKKFWGRIPVNEATAQYYFTRESLMQHLMHQFKYRGNKELGLELGRLMGERLIRSGRFNIDALVPLPLFASKEKRRGFNQAAVLCDGMAEVMNLPVLKNTVIRSRHTETQTKKGRVERWQNMEGKFVLINEDNIRDRHLLLVDDVVTTGATLEACGTELLKGHNTKLSIATLCYTSH